MDRVSNAAAILGRKGGLAGRGASQRRKGMTSEHMRAVRAKRPGSSGCRRCGQPESAHSYGRCPGDMTGARLIGRVDVRLADGWAPVIWVHDATPERMDAAEAAALLQYGGRIVDTIGGLTRRWSARLIETR